jgi:hypothetical protein
MRASPSLLFFCLGACLAVAGQSARSSGDAAPTDDSSKPRVFITDSQSWEIVGRSGGAGGAFGGTVQGGARPQTAEVIKTFGERCPQVLINNIQTKADYIVLLDHEGGKSVLRHKNKVAVFARVTGDSIVSKSTLSLGGSVQDACEAINKDWSTHGPALRAARTTADAPVKATTPQASADPPPARSSSAALSVTSIPDGADIELDSTFVGNTPSELQVTDGEHTIAIKKAGFKTWERKLKVSGGSAVHLKAELEKLSN